MTSLFGHLFLKNGQMTQNNALYSNKQNVPLVSTEGPCEGSLLVSEEGSELLLRLGLHVGHLAALGLVHQVRQRPVPAPHRRRLPRRGGVRASRVLDRNILIGSHWCLWILTSRWMWSNWPKSLICGWRNWRYPEQQRLSDTQLTSSVGTNVVSYPDPRTESRGGHWRCVCRPRGQDHLGEPGLRCRRLGARKEKNAESWRKILQNALRVWNSFGISPILRTINLVV